MADILTSDSTVLPERRRIERRSASRIGDLTLPEVRRILITLLLSGVVLTLFLWMVRTVIVASILGMIIGFYIRPLYLVINRRIHRSTLSAILTLCAVIVPVVSGLAWDLSGIPATAFVPIALCGLVLVILAPAINHIPRMER